MIKRWTAAFLAALTMMTAISGCTGKSREAAEFGNRYEASFLELFDTVTKIVGYAKDKETFEGNVKKIKDELEKYHRLFDIYHTYDGLNNLKTINDQAGKAPVKTDPIVIEMLKFAIEENKKTNGNVNIAFGSVLSIWHKYRTEGIDDPEHAKLPSMEELEEAAKHTDINKVVIDEKEQTVYLDDPEMSLDVGAVAKGYATEKVAQTIEKEGITNLMLSVGGNIRTIGKKLDEKGNVVNWAVGIQNPDEGSDQAIVQLLSLSGQSLVTSGVYERYYTVDGKNYHHIIDPDTLMPSDEYLSVSILCDSSAVADAYSTAVFNMPIDEGKQFIENSDGVEAFWIMADGSYIYSSGFKNYLEDK